MQITLLELAGWLCPFALIILAFLKLLGISRKSYIASFRVIKRHTVAVLVICLVVVFFIFVTPFLLNKFVDATTPRWMAWLQTFAGNWSPDAFLSVLHTSPSEGSSSSASYEFSVSAAIAILLNNAIIIGLIGLVWRLVKERNRVMNVATALLLRDSFAKSAAEELAEDHFPEGERDKVMELFKAALAQADADLEKHLPNIDEGEAQDILDTIRIAKRRTERAQPAA